MDYSFESGCFIHLFRLREDKSVYLFLHGPGFVRKPKSWGEKKSAENRKIVLD